jgi:hypothetical protein
MDSNGQYFLGADTSSAVSLQTTVPAPGTGRDISALVMAPPFHGDKITAEASKAFALAKGLRRPLPTQFKRFTANRALITRYSRWPSLGSNACWERFSPRERHFFLWQVYDLMPKLELTLASTNFIFGGRGREQKHVDQLCVDRAFVCDDPAVVAGRVIAKRACSFGAGDLYRS